MDLDKRALEVLIYGPGGPFEELVSASYTCSVTERGKMCTPTDQETKGSSSYTASGSEVQAGGSSSSGRQGATCGVMADCDLSNGYICSKEEKDIYVDDSYLTSSCKWVSEVALAFTAYTILDRAGVCNPPARCLLSDTEGTIEIVDESGNTDKLNDLPDLGPCPCNCTYASSACCLTAIGLVHEDPAQRAKETIL